MEAEEPAVVRAAASQALTRREFGAVALAAGGLTLLQKAAPPIGVQSYSFRDRSLADAIAAMNKLGLTSCELWQSHVEPRGISREELRQWRETVPLDHFHAVRDQLAEAKITLNAYNISITDSFSDQELERAFDMTTALGAPLITSSSNIKTVERIAPVAQRRKMVVAMHNHSRIDPNEFATANSLTEAMAKNRYIWTNLDIGHFTAANQDAVAFIKQHHNRIVTLHLKDRKRDQGPNVEFGAGDTPIVEVLKLVAGNRWPLPMNIEYEYKGGDTVAEVGKCLAYCRKALGL
jgi:sugar phosphate isomerase/epimerase